MTTIQLFQILKPRLGERETGALATKEDHFVLKEELAAFRLEFKSEIARLEIKMGDLKSDLIRWMFALFVTLMLAILGLYFKH